MSKYSCSFYILIMIRLGLGQQFDVTTDLQLPNIEPVKLESYARIDLPQLKEASGLIKSRLWKDVFWTHNDSGNKPRIFPLGADGSIIKPQWMKDHNGIEIPDAVNVDWESITTDNSGNLYIGDCGNNGNMRRDLCIYIVKEPYPAETVITSTFRKINFYYPDQKEFPPAKKNFDAEAIFWNRGNIYLLTKHRSDDSTKLYRLSSLDPLQEVPAVLIGRFSTRGRVTGADISDNGLELAVLTINSIWLFTLNHPGENFFSGKISWLPLAGYSKEGIAFDGDSMILNNEAGKLFRVFKKDLVPVRE